MAGESWRSEYRVFHGGLMRCCLATLGTFMAEGAERPPQDGDVLSCAYHEGSGMIFRCGAWQWDQSIDFRHGGTHDPAS